MSLGPSADASPDGTSSGPDATASPDGSGSEGGDTGTPPSDAIPPPADAITNFCANAGQHLFCDDFDSSSNLKAKWDAQIAVGATNAQLDTAIFLSAPQSYLAQTTQPVTGEAATVLEKRFSNLHGFTVTLDAYVDSYGSDKDAGSVTEYVGVEFMQSGPLSLSLLIVGPDVAGVAESSNADGGTGSTAFYRFTGASGFVGLGGARWTHVVIAGTYPTASAAGHVTAHLDGVVVLDRDLVSPAIPAGDSTLSLGLYVSQSPNLWSVHFDNVLVDGS